MDKNKKLLLISSILMFVYLLFCFCIIMITHEKVDILSIVLYSLYLIGACLFMYYSAGKGKVNRGLVFLFSIILFLGNIVSGVLGFVYHSKTSTYKKRELPKLEIKHDYNKIVYILIFIVSMGLMFILPLFYDNRILNYSIEGLITLTLAYVFKNDLKRDFKYFKEYFREYSSYVFKMFLIAMAFMLILNISIRTYTGLTEATNQSDIRVALTSYPILIIILAVFIAPFMEELLFRGIFRKVFNNKWVFILTSGILFGVVHVIDDFKTPKELLFILTYSALGIFLGSVYHKTNNIYSNMFFHFIQNAFAMIVMILTTFLMK